MSALRQQKEMKDDHNSQQHVRSEGSATAELLRLKDHLIDVEKNVRVSFEVHTVQLMYNV